MLDPSSLIAAGGSIPFTSEHFWRVILAVLLGGSVGFERELRDKPAGFRTIILICLGACILSIVSESVGAPDQDRARIAAQIVSGIGFLGAGAILHNKQSVVGMTTAATIWAVAAVGMAVGFGEYALATLGTAAILAALYLFSVLEEWVGDRRDMQEYRIVARRPEGTLEAVNRLFAEDRVQVRKRNFYNEGATVVLHIIGMGAKTDHDRLREKFLRSDEYSLQGP